MGSIVCKGLGFVGFKGGAKRLFRGSMIIGDELKTSFQLYSGFRNFRKMVSLHIS